MWDLSNLTSLITSASALPIVAQLLIILPILFIVISRILEYTEYRISRRNITTNNTLTFLESILNNLKHEFMDTVKTTLRNARHDNLDDMDKKELFIISLVISIGLDIQTKERFKEIFFTNGYYHKIKNGENISEILELRCTDLRNIIIDAVDDVLRDNSPLRGVLNQKYSVDESRSIYESIIYHHVSEIDDEIADINDELKRLFGGWVTKIYKYQHKKIPNKIKLKGAEITG